MEKMMVRTYDVNVYVVDGVVRLSAYEHKYSDNPEAREPIETNTEKFHTISFPMGDDHREEISYLLDSDEWDDLDQYPDGVAVGWQDYDSPWEQLDWLYEGDTPEKIRVWADLLPEYAPEVAHEWVENNFMGMERGTILKTMCKNCDASYDIRRLTVEEMAR
jgi:hypothetical protein